ncbi:NifU family protein [Mycobacterium kansasii]|uniref:NifU-like domain protein n=3 Tax=Mycobacterium kansasii TaxID=1768 RepID=A0A1V3WSM2_MYCKA|nr:NifU family protein [Mycobacterium kansasii]EUA05378.1 nifU-like domain protein [Mycobacterium kansasii 824]AGZ51704.1 nitrogen fixation protein NifU [Mycobacterium kansasii ATCC 12478]ARG56566.1 NifU family protein [Mycobacterium kansasii]ARG62018.1 NifU family protein [Mycobacterium kansasii]ARG69710.1 NifU family protein [Mycobacterium kansasii]
MIPLHATATGDPRQLRWVAAPDRLPPLGVVRHAPGRLGALLKSGLIAEIAVRATDILITVGATRSWRELGDDIRTALTDALVDPAGWRVEQPTSSEAQLTTLAQELLAGPIGELAGSHGGSIELVSVVGLNVTVRMSGACRGCLAANSTLRDRLQRELRRRAGIEVTVIAENTSVAVVLGKKLRSLAAR